MDFSVSSVRPAFCLTVAFVSSSNDSLMYPTRSFLMSNCAL